MRSKFVSFKWNGDEALAAYMKQSVPGQPNVIPVETKGYVAGASPEWLASLRPATEDEYASLKETIEQDYKIRVVVIGEENA